MKLSQRLSHLQAMVDGPYEHIWDCCCDHGLLGAALLKKQVAGTMHFVDIVPGIMQTLQDKLERFFPLNQDATSPQWRVHCMDVAKLPLANYPSETPHLVIIAGVGGELTGELVSAIQASADALGQNIEFLLCPVHHTYQLRDRLSAIRLGLVDEKLISENKRCYELLHVARHGKRPITAIGDRLWSQAPIETQVAYLRRLLKHYHQVVRGSQLEQKPLLDRAISDYQAQLDLLSA
ncbi:tRNA (adenine(22)-N(1))-methyltransferase TrmK [Shewanella sp. Isolate8]|uniref:tRNA (adenine(22)-N(1))-methyltransferase n=1 Tax=Shewanella sp. Isolate8 TaxID=2908529 RepID=UPI001EFE5631|nr:tRNA (adenine(22)-N(1))-methyltransferase TrmK [Shewanella sp. Isolate8]MCG9747234.1 tRNA (adenine(22)-N(1))-methyltransferase TrmK [Shewanella sp. Isolate8]